MNKHCEDFKKFFANQINVASFKAEMLEVVKQKRGLGLIPCLPAGKNSNEVTEFADDIVFLLANHDPVKTKLSDELGKIKGNGLNLKFLTANFMGYGLYQEGVYELDDFMTKFERKI